MGRGRVLSIAYAASIGGMATDRFAPNGIFARFVEQTYDTPVTFLAWMKVALPVTLLNAADGVLPPDACALPLEARRHSGQARMGNC